MRGKKQVISRVILAKDQNRNMDEKSLKSPPLRFLAGIPLLHIPLINMELNSIPSLKKQKPSFVSRIKGKSIWCNYLYETESGFKFLVRGWSHYKNIRLILNAKKQKNKNITVGSPWEKLRLEGHIYSMLDKENITPRFIAILPKTGFIVREYIQGINLTDKLLALIRKKSNMNHNEISALLEKVVKVIFKLHSLGIIHGDLSPENIIITNTNNGIKLIDFEWAWFHYLPPRSSEEMIRMDLQRAIYKLESKFGRDLSTIFLNTITQVYEGINIDDLGYTHKR